MNLPGWGLVVSAEHASRAVPDGLDNLGIDPAHFQTHVVWDPGTYEVSERVATHFGAPLYRGDFTRILVDLNRSAHNPEAVPAVAFGVTVPANQSLTQADRAARIATYHQPYWRAVQEAVRQALVTHERVLHLSVHSFTPSYEGVKREVELGVMMDPDRMLERLIADRWLVSLASGGLLVRENEPYDGRADALVTGLRTVFSAERYAGVEIEISHALLDRLDEVAAALCSAITALGED